MRKSWAQKYQTAKNPHISVLDKPYSGYPVGSRILISTPEEIQSIVASIPVGETVEIHDLRERLANAHGADFTCPLTTGIFLRIVAEAALENGDSLPFWRVIRPDSALARKISCGPEFIVERRNEEARAHALR